MKKLENGGGGKFGDTDEFYGSGCNYQTGYSLGVGAVVLNEARVLLVKRASGVKSGWWAIPGGYVESNETIDQAVRREVYEETGVRADVNGLVAVRNRIHESGNDNSAYFIFLMTTRETTFRLAPEEVSDAGFFSVDEINELHMLLPLCKRVAVDALKGGLKSLQLRTLPEYSPENYILYL